MKEMKRVLSAFCAFAIVLASLAGGLALTGVETAHAEQRSSEAGESKTLSAPQNVRKEEVLDKGVYKDCVVWDEVEGAYSYIVRVKNGSGETVVEEDYEYMEERSVEWNRFFYEHRMDFGDYTFDLCVLDQDKAKSAWSNTVAVPYVPDPALAVPGNVGLSEDGEDIVWDAVEGAYCYNWRIFQNGSVYTERYGYKGTSVWLENYVYGDGDYSLEIQVMDQNYNASAWSEPLEFSYSRPVDPEVPYDPDPQLEAPTNVRLDESGNNVLWDAVEGATSYRILVESLWYAEEYEDFDWVYEDWNSEGAYVYVSDAEELQYNWKSLVYPYSKGKCRVQIYARGSGFSNSDWSEPLIIDFTPTRDESIGVPENVWLEGEDLEWDEIENAKRYWSIFSLDSEEGTLENSSGNHLASYLSTGRYIEGNILPAGAYGAEIFVVDENGNFNSKKYPVVIDTVPDESVWVPKLYARDTYCCWDWDKFRHDNTSCFWIRFSEGGNVVRLAQRESNRYTLSDMKNGKYTVEICAVDYDYGEYYWEDIYKIGNWSEPKYITMHNGSPYDEENESTTEVEKAPEAAGIPDSDRITTITCNPPLNMKYKDGDDVEIDLAKIKVKAKEIYDEEGLKRAEEALGKEIVGNKQYNLLDLTLWEGERDISNAYDGLVQVIISLPKGHRDKTFSCYRLTEVDGKMTKEVIPGEQTEDSYIIYLEHFSQYALVADGGEGNDITEEPTEKPAEKPTEPSAEKPTVYGEWEYELLEDGTAEITAYKGNEAELEIPESIDGVSVTNIGDHAFSGCSGLTSVTVPDSVTSIGDGAFERCGGLTSVTIPDSVTNIGVFAFSFCSGLTSVTIPEGVTVISNGVFYDCSGLTGVTLPKGVTSIGDYAFERCSGLTSVTIPKSVTSIGDCAFCDCSGLTGVTLPKGVTSIGQHAFYGCRGLTSVTIPKGVTEIGYMAFGFVRDGNDYAKIPDFTICGYPDTAAEAYAKENGFIFIASKEEAGETPAQKPSEPVSDVAGGDGAPSPLAIMLMIVGIVALAAGVQVISMLKADKAAREK